MGCIRPALYCLRWTGGWTRVACPLALGVRGEDVYLHFLPMSPGTGGTSLLLPVHLPGVLGQAALGLVLSATVSADVGDLPLHVTMSSFVWSAGAVTMSTFAMRVQAAGGQELPITFGTRISLA